MSDAAIPRSLSGQTSAASQETPSKRNRFPSEKLKHLQNEQAEIKNRQAPRSSPTAVGNNRTTKASPQKSLVFPVVDEEDDDEEDEEEDVADENEFAEDEPVEVQEPDAGERRDEKERVDVSKFPIYFFLSSLSEEALDRAKRLQLVEADIPPDSPFDLNAVNAVLSKSAPPEPNLAKRKSSAMPQIRSNTSSSKPPPTLIAKSASNSSAGPAKPAVGLHKNRPTSVHHTIWTEQKQIVLLDSSESLSWDARTCFNLFFFFAVIHCDIFALENGYNNRGGVSKNWKAVQAKMSLKFQEFEAIDWKLLEEE